MPFPYLTTIELPFGPKLLPLNVMLVRFMTLRMVGETCTYVGGLKDIFSNSVGLLWSIISIYAEKPSRLYPALAASVVHLATWFLTITSQFLPV